MNTHPDNISYSADQADRDVMTKYWEEHSDQATLEEMMLDNSANKLDQLERPEILSLLPDFGGMKVLELGAGIG